MGILILVCAGLLILAAYWVFRVLLPVEYQRWGRLRIHASTLELLIWVGYIAFPYLYNPPDWALPWIKPEDLSYGQWLTGLVLIILGIALAFGIMFWFGLKRAFGLHVTDLVSTGPYAWSRNPQLVFGSLMIVGVIVQRPSLYAVLWGVMALLIGHWMVLAEEKHLETIIGKVYEDYCLKVPRYIGRRN